LEKVSIGKLKSKYIKVKNFALTFLTMSIQQREIEDKEREIEFSDRDIFFIRFGLALLGISFIVLAVCSFFIPELVNLFVIFMIGFVGIVYLICAFLPREVFKKVIEKRMGLSVILRSKIRNRYWELKK